MRERLPFNQIANTQFGMNTSPAANGKMLIKCATVSLEPFTNAIKAEPQNDINKYVYDRVKQNIKIIVAQCHKSRDICHRNAARNSIFLVNSISFSLPHTQPNRFPVHVNPPKSEILLSIYQFRCYFVRMKNVGNKNCCHSSLSFVSKSNQTKMVRCFLL